MLERLKLPVNVGVEVLGALREVLDGPQVDDLRAGGLDGGVLFGQQLEVFQLFRGKLGSGSFQRLLLLSNLPAAL